MGQAIDAIDLGAIGETAALVNERSRIRAAMRFGLGPLPDPLYFVIPRRRLILMEKMVRAIITEGLTAPPGNPHFNRYVRRQWQHCRPGLAHLAEKGE